MSGTNKSLLDEIVQASNLSYLSDLTLVQNFAAVTRAVANIPLNSFSDNSWKDAVVYISKGNATSATGLEARQYLLKLK